MFIYSIHPPQSWPAEGKPQEYLVQFVKKLRKATKRKPVAPHINSLSPHLARDVVTDAKRSQGHSPSTPFFFRDHPRL